MKLSRNVRWMISVGSAALMSCMLYSCVTVNVPVNFPESTVQRATDDYVRELYRAKEKGRTPLPKPEASKSPEKASGFLIASAWAVEIEGVFKVKTDKSLKIRERMAGRLEEVLRYKREGVLGESNDGELVLRNPSKLKDLLRKKVEKLVADENSDRSDLYSEVVSANSLAKDRVKDVSRNFAKSFQAESPSGTHVQDSDGKWAQKP